MTHVQTKYGLWLLCVLSAPSNFCSQLVMESPYEWHIRILILCSFLSTHSHGLCAPPLMVSSYANQALLPSLILALLLYNAAGRSYLWHSNLLSFFRNQF
uniref:Secreted protein n=1 Tax=Anopheles darlingi TaxID=43151 RepID=A0A2M4D8S4_ANODA